MYDSVVRELRSLHDRSWDSFGMLVLELGAENLPTVVSRLREGFGFSLFLDVTAIDYPERAPRFDVVYHLYSRTHNRRIRLKVPVSEQHPKVPSLTSLYGSARFMEREAHEMYGIEFTGNGDLRPLLLYEGFVGHPLRKDYPMDREQPIVTYRK